MNVHAILNAESGTLKSTDIDALSAHVTEAFSTNGSAITCVKVGSRDVGAALSDAAASDEIDVILVGGGDGSISSAAGVAWKSGKTLGVLPAGTLNLFARSLQVPLDVFEAASALARGREVNVDIATANDRPFVHQVSVGFQARSVRLRDQVHHATRFKKMVAGLRAVASVIHDPPYFPVRTRIDGDGGAESLVSAVAVTNNLIGGNLLPYAERLDEGRLGLYHIPRIGSLEAAYVFLDIVRGKAAENELISVNDAKHVQIEFPKNRRTNRAVIDGELVNLPDKLDVRIHPRELQVLVPPADAEEAAE